MQLLLAHRSEPYKVSNNSDDCLKADNPLSALRFNSPIWVAQSQPNLR